MPDIQSAVEAFTEGGKKKKKKKCFSVFLTAPRKAKGLEDVPGMRLCHK